MGLDHIGSRIRFYREQKDLTVAELAQGIVSPHMVELTEQAIGDPSPKVVRRFAERLGVPFDHLARGTKYELVDQH